MDFTWSFSFALLPLATLDLVVNSIFVELCCIARLSYRIA
jgi:hypothetical protein